MGNLLAKAARGFAVGATNLANDALAELRAQRMQEFQYNLGAGDRAQARQDANDHFQKSYDLQKTGQDNTKDYQDRSLGVQEENMRADNKSRSAQLGISQKQLELAQRQEGFGEFQHAVIGATSNYQGLLAKKGEIALWAPRTDKEGNQTESDAQFGARQKRAMANVSELLQKEQPRVAQAVDKLRASYPQFSSVIPDKTAFDGANDGSSKPAPAAASDPATMQTQRPSQQAQPSDPYSSLPEDDESKQAKQVLLDRAKQGADKIRQDAAAKAEQDRQDLIDQRHRDNQRVLQGNDWYSGSQVTRGAAYNPIR